MLGRRSFVAAVSAFVAAPHAHATLPEGPIRLLTPVPPGGSPDLVARLIAGKLAESWQRTVLVDNRPGADGIIAVRALIEDRASVPLLLAPSGLFTVTPLLREVPFDTQVDVQPISTIAADYLVVAVHAASGPASFHELIGGIAAKPGTIDWFAVAGAPVLAFESLLRTRGLSATHVPYKGGPDAMRDLAEGRIAVAVVPLSVARPHLAAGRVRVMAVTNPERAPGIEAPSVAELGYPEMAVEGVLGLFGQKKMASELAARIANDVRIVLSQPEIKTSFLNQGSRALGSTPIEYDQYLNSQIARWRPEATFHRDKS